ncbi:MAG: pyridoxamine 5'-phosphate oxidase [Verrucomicrobiota bacterium]
MRTENPIPGNAKEPPSLADLRQDYRQASLRRNEVAADPFHQFRAWFDQARESGIVEPNAMTLSTVDSASGQPSSRVVLLKGLDDRGFLFFTNYQSRKGRELAAQPRAALGFFWKELERQVNVRGTVEFVTREESGAYFHSRPRGSQLGAHASAQSSVIPGREWLEEQFAALDRKYPEGTEIPLPCAWGGYRLIPEAIEFWQGRTSRLHDRLCYTRQEDGFWKLDRLSP